MEQRASIDSTILGIRHIVILVAVVTLQNTSNIIITHTSNGGQANISSKSMSYPYFFIYMSAEYKCPTSSSSLDLLQLAETATRGKA